MKAYQYTPLPEADKPDDIYIRLLKLPPGPSTGRIACSLLTVPLSQAPTFQALSYCWGDAPRQRIYIVPSTSPNTSSTWDDDQALEDADARSLQVPASLIPFLLRTRMKGEERKTERVLWVDSVCINQEDNEEKDRQVNRMRDIYIKAACTLIWLGPAGERSAAALSYADNLTHKFRVELEAKSQTELDPSKREDMSHVKITVGHPDLGALFAILNRPYFERAWIVQEVVVARLCWVIIGDHVLHYTWFLSAYVYLLHSHAWIFEYYPGHRLALISNHRISSKEWEDKVDIEWWRLLSRHRECRSKDPRDKVFAFWGLRCKDEFIKMGIRPGYGKEKEKRTEMVYWKLAVEALRRGHVEVLSVPRLVLRRGGGDDEKTITGDLKPLDMPSWVPDWRHTSLTPESLQRFESTSPNWKPSFNACKDFSFPSPFPGLDSTVSNDPEKLIPLQELPTELRLRGYTIAKITALTSSPWALQTPPCSQTIHTQALVLQENQLQIVDWEAVLFTHNPSSIYTPTGESNMDARYKTLMAGIFTESDAFVRSAYLAFERRQKVLRFIAWIGLAKYLWPFMVVVLVGHLLRYFGIQNSEIQFRSKIPGMVNRKGARLKSGIGATEYMGLVPGLCEVGDVVVICEGVKVPLVLRNRAESVGAEVSRGGVEIEADKGKVKWEFIGDAYVHGVMDGKNWDEKKCEDICIT